MSGQLFAAAFLCLLGMAPQYGFSQPACGPVAENFDNTSGSSAGFSGDLSLNTTAGDGYLEKRNVLSSGVYTVVSPTFQAAASATSVGYGFVLNGSERIAQVSVSIIFRSTLNNEITTVFLNRFAPSYSNNSNYSEECQGVTFSSLPGFPEGGQYRFRIELIPVSGAGAVSQFIRFDDFRTTGSRSQALLPLAFTGISLLKDSRGTQLTWQVAGEEKTLRYEIETSADGRRFSKAGILPANGTSHYNFAVNEKERAFYRVKGVSTSGQVSYSSIVRVSIAGTSTSLSAFPQPVRHQVTLRHATVTGQSRIVLSSAEGRLVKTINPAVGSQQTVINTTALSPGVYWLRFNNGDSSTEAIRILKQ